MKNFNTIRVPVAITLILAVVLPALVIDVVTAALGVQTAFSQSQSQLETVVALKESQVNFWIENTLEELSPIAADTDFVLRVRQALPDSDFPTLRDRAQDEIQQILLQNRRSSQQFTDLFLVTTDGTTVVSTSPDDLNIIFDEASEPTILTPSYNEETQTTSAVALYPVYDGANLIAVVGGIATTESLDEIMLAEAGLGETGNTYLVNAEGTLLTPSRIEGYPIGQTNVNTEATTNNSGEGLYSSYHNEEVVGVYRRLSELGVTLIAEQNQNEVLSPTYFTLSINVITTVIAVVIFVVGGIIFVNNAIIRAIGNLSETAQEIANGNLSLRSDIQRNDEIGQLANAFNSMTTSLASAIDEREQSIQLIQEKNQALRIATNKAREAARIKGEFLSTMSHELRTPLNAIIGFSDMLLMGMSGELNPKQEHKVRRLQENGKRLLELVNDSLDLTRIESGRIELQPAPFNVHEMADRMKEQMQVLADQEKLEFVVTIDEALPSELVGDRQRIEQIIVNLLSNAFKFTDDGSVNLSFTRQDEDNWVIAVADTGIGIPPHARDLIFEEFRQLDGSTRRVYKGTGLGLAITRHLVKMMEGRITVDSELGEGSTFTVTLPLLHPEDIPLETALATEGID